MESQLSNFSHNCTLYPGTYIPSLDANELKTELAKMKKEDISEPSVNVTEEEDSFKLEAALPGIRREDFFINIEKNVLTITVLHRRIRVTPEGKFQMHEFDHDCFNRHVMLPEHVETEFVRAEYLDGMLTMYLPKSNHAQKEGSTRVIVY
jgi:HSP20 family protein